MKTIQEKSNGGLEIFKEYIQTPFNLDEKTSSEYIDGVEFMILWSDRYGNYIMKVWKNGMHYANWNAIWFLKEFNGMRTIEACERIDDDLNLGVLNQDDSNNEEGDAPRDLIF